MDKETLSHYGWIVVLVLILSVMMALATPLGEFIAGGFKATYVGFGNVSENALGILGMSNPVNPAPNPGTENPNPGTEKMECGHDVGTDGDHSKLGCGDFACENCGHTPAPCEIEGHYIGDGREPHGVAPGYNQCFYDHKYTCQCGDVWVVPEGGTYTAYYGIDGKKVFVGGEALPCKYRINDNDTFTYGDYIYTYLGVYNYGWDVQVNTNVVDTNQKTYGSIMDEIFFRPVTNMTKTFENFTSLEVAPEIPDSVIKMGFTFNGCTSLTTAPLLPSNLQEFRDTFKNCTSLKTYAGSSDAEGNFENYIIPSGTTRMDNAFYNCDAMVYGPDISNCTVLTKMEYAFHDCDALKKVNVIPESVQVLTWTFKDCDNLIEAPDMSNAKAVTRMDGTFYNCKSLMIAPNISNCTQLTNLIDTFSGCVALKTYHGNADADGNFKHYIIPQSVTSMSGTFNKCELLTHAPDISNNTNLTDVASAFKGCKALKEVSALPTNVTNISHIFHNCENLITYYGNTDADGNFSNYTIPSSVTKTDYAFNGCKKVQTKPTALT